MWQFVCNLDRKAHVVVDGGGGGGGGGGGKTTPPLQQLQLKPALPSPPRHLLNILT